MGASDEFDHFPDVDSSVTLIWRPGQLPPMMQQTSLIPILQPKRICVRLSSNAHKKFKLGVILFRQSLMLRKNSRSARHQRTRWWPVMLITLIPKSGPPLPQPSRSRTSLPLSNPHHQMKTAILTMRLTLQKNRTPSSPRLNNLTLFCASTKADGCALHLMAMSPIKSVLKCEKRRLRMSTAGPWMTSALVSPWSFQHCS